MVVVVGRHKGLHRGCLHGWAAVKGGAHARQCRARYIPASCPHVLQHTLQQRALLPLEVKAVAHSARL